MGKFEVKKEYKELFKASAKKPNLLKVPSCNFLKVDGAGDPNTTKDFEHAIEALYGTAYGVKFSLKKDDADKDFTVPPLEGLWYMDKMEYWSEDNKDDWQWTLMIMMPPFVKKADVTKQYKALVEKKGDHLPEPRFEKYNEGLSAQIMHIGPYTEELPTIKKLHEFVDKEGYELSGYHHEVYLGDPRKTAPEKLKTIIRQPVKKKK